MARCESLQNHKHLVALGTFCVTCFYNKSRTTRYFHLNHPGLCLGVGKIPVAVVNLVSSFGQFRIVSSRINSLANRSGSSFTLEAPSRSNRHPLVRRVIVRRVSSAFLLSIVAFSPLVQGQSSVPGISSDGNTITITAPGGLQAPSLTVNGAGAGAIVLQQGTSQGAAPSNSIQITAPASVSAYTLTLPHSGPDPSHPILAFSPDGTGYFAAVPAGTTASTGGVTLGANTFNAPQTVNGGNSSLPLVITSSSANGASIALDNTSVGGNYTLLYTNASKNVGLWDYTHFRDTFTCSQTDGAVSCGATHMLSTSGQPTIAAGVGAGSGAYAAFETSGNNVPSDQSGLVSVTTGGSPNAGSVVATVIFNQAWLRTNASQIQASAYAPACTISPANAAAASLYGAASVYASIASPSSFSIFSNASPLAPNTTYVWTYKCM